MNDVAALLADLESSRMERTRSLNDTDKFCKAICASRMICPAPVCLDTCLLAWTTRASPRERQLMSGCWKLSQATGIMVKYFPCPICS